LIRKDRGDRGREHRKVAKSLEKDLIQGSNQGRLPYAAERKGQGSPEKK